MVDVREKGSKTTVTVTCWPAEDAEWYVTSSNVAAPSNRDAQIEWLDRDKDLISKRLQSGGRDKGRVLYVWEDRWFQGRPLVAVLLIHVEGGRLQASHIKVCAEYKTNLRKAVLVTDVLLSCMAEVVREAGQPDGCFDWLFDNESAAADAKNRWGQSRKTQIKSPKGKGRGRRQRQQVALEICPG